MIQIQLLINQQNDLLSNSIFLAILTQPLEEGAPFLFIKQAKIKINRLLVLEKHSFKI